MFFSLSPLSNSLIFLARDPWCRKVSVRDRKECESGILSVADSLTFADTPTSAQLSVIVIAGPTNFADKWYGIDRC